LVVIGSAGYITLEASRWLRDVGAALVHIDAEGALVAQSAAVGSDFPALRRAQALSANSPVGLALAPRSWRGSLAARGRSSMSFPEAIATALRSTWRSPSSRRRPQSVP
jgi:hypothetical protein